MNKKYFYMKKCTILYGKVSINLKNIRIMNTLIQVSSLNLHMKISQENFKYCDSEQIYISSLNSFLSEYQYVIIINILIDIVIIYICTYLYLTFIYVYMYICMCWGRIVIFLPHITFVVKNFIHE